MLRSCLLRLEDLWRGGEVLWGDGDGPKRACMAGGRDVVDLGGGREPEDDVERAPVGDDNAVVVIAKGMGVV
jgi:hypothetical protein